MPPAQETVLCMLLFQFPTKFIHGVEVVLVLGDVN
jgi:hypothetical protein